MPGLIPENILEDILNRIDIVEVISGCLPLKRAGRNFKACCPFHHEKTPSFMVSPERQIYHCFGCGESGNAFRFLMRHERMEFPEAVEALARKAGVVLPQIKAQDHKGENLITQFYKINELAASFYAANLNSAAAVNAKNYLLKRGIKEESVKLFRLGLAAHGWDTLMAHLRAKNVPLSLIEKAGLVLSKQGGGFYDWFRNRIIFPVVDIKSRVVGFGARVLDETQPKYINSPETPIYTKGRNLYGLNFSKESIRENDFAVIVEGYLDFIVPYQEGLKNIVASLGTALTPEQARILKRYTRNVVMVYDADNAGQLAMLRSLDIFIEEEMEVKIVSLSLGFDPDSFVRKYGIGPFREKIAKAQGLFDYKLAIMKSRHNPKEAQGKARISQEMLGTINKFKDAVLRSEYIRQLAQELDIREDALLEEAKKVRKFPGYAGANLRPNAKKELNINPAEKLLIALMLRESELIHYIRERLDPADFMDEKISKIVSLCFNFAEEGKDLSTKSLLNYFGDEGLSQIVCESVFLPDELSQQNKEKLIEDCLCRIKEEKIKLTRQRLHEEIKRAQDSKDEQRLERLTEEFNSLLKKR
ncbi:MAG: DNA primase [Candidatus Omnitrophica bacterium]|nr:DNA primase [Candidatus Omnitrophota bacterium]MBL7210556.1 DNA primase [Candidatus Omnitrophota bacterium]